MWQKYSFIKDKDLMRLFGFPLILFIFFSAFLYSQTSESSKSQLPLAFDEKRDPSVDLKYAVTLAKKKRRIFSWMWVANGAFGANGWMSF